jgi:hypothetical protein
LSERIERVITSLKATEYLLDSAATFTRCVKFKVERWNPTNAQTFGDNASKVRGCAA